MEVIIFFTMLVIQTTGCESQHSFEHFNNECIFYINYKDRTCTDFSFAGCVGTYDDDCSSGDGMVGCGYFNYKEWSNCVYLCCDPSVSYAQNSDAINQCQGYLNQENTKNIIIAVSVNSVVAIILLILFLRTCCCPCRCRREEPVVIHPSPI
jgi:hypothetical protein